MCVVHAPGMHNRAPSKKCSHGDDDIYHITDPGASIRAIKVLAQSLGDQCKLIPVLAFPRLAFASRAAVGDSTA